MDSASLKFIGFGLLVAVISNFRPSAVWRSRVLLIANAVFIGLLVDIRNPVTLIPIAGFLLFGYLGLILIRRGVPKGTIISVLVILTIYAWLKKYTFLPESSFLHFAYFTLGLSYIFFRILHLFIETGSRTERSVITPGNYIAYTLNFTTYVSGPIQNYDDFARYQFALEPLSLDAGVIGLQIERIVRGFFKVNIAAMLFHAVQQDALNQLFEPFGLHVKLVAAFRLALVGPFFLYCNFSGYIDIVIALARLMRLRLPENFNRPFSASSFLDFWSRWHITLSLWLKTYVYNPLLMFLMRRISSPVFTPVLGVFCFFVTFFLVGIWHGRTSEFAVFGVLQGGGVAINKLWQISLTKTLGRKLYKQLAANPAYVAFARGLTFSWFAFTLFWFWADWKQINAILGSIGLIDWIAVWLAIWLSATIVLAAWEPIRSVLLTLSTGNGPIFTNKYARVFYGSLLALASLLITAILNQSTPDLVYKAF
jgi:alginate O-acetyltransferase complex protein AlgI